MLCPIGQSNEKPPLQALAKWWEYVTGGWSVRSNQESGNGFSDISIRIDDADLGIVIEVKYAENGQETKECQRALKQIIDMQYEEALRQADIHKILKYGIACNRKMCKVAMTVENIAN